MGSKGVSDFLLLPLLATFFGLLVYFLGVKKEMDGGKALWKWAGVLIMGVGAFSAWPDFAILAGLGSESDRSLYTGEYVGRRFTLSIYGGFLIPVVAIIASVAIGQILVSKSRRAEITEPG